MSARLRLKQLQAQKRGFKPQIPDVSDEDSLAEVPGLVETEPDIKQGTESDSVMVSEKKRLFVLSCSRFISWFASIFRFAWRTTASVFTKLKNFQKSYLESITAESPQEESPLFPQNHELVQVKNLPEEDPVFAQQIEETSRQLTELHRSLPPEPSNPEPLKQEKSVEEEEEAFDADDFDEAVRRARLKLVMAAALVFFGVGGFLGYQFVFSRWSQENTIASEENESKKVAPALEDDDEFFSPKSITQLVEQTPPIAAGYPMPEEIEENAFTPAAIPQFDSQYDDLTLEVPDLDLPMDDFDFQASLFNQEEYAADGNGDFMNENENEEITAQHVVDPVLPSTFSLGSTQHFGLSVTPPSHDVPLQAQVEPRQTLRGETQGTTVTISNSEIAGLPSPPNSTEIAHRAVPAVPFAGRFQESNENQDHLNLFEEEPFLPNLAAPNQRYQADAAVQTPPRQRAITFGQAQSPTQAPVETRMSSVQGENRQYTVQDGDNLFNVASRELGDVTRWREIQRLNREAFGDNIGYLTPGTVISMPE